MLAPFREALEVGLLRFGLKVEEGEKEKLEKFADRLLLWNKKVNLTAITDPAEVAEKHIVDSLVLLPSVASAGTLLDVGSGAGLPGVPLACVDRQLLVTCIDSVAKKVAFVKAVTAELELNVRALALRAQGDPERENLPLFGAVVSRAVGEPGSWLKLAAPYAQRGGLVLSLLGREADERSLASLGEEAGLKLIGLDRYALPVSGSLRAVARFVRQ